MFTLPRCVAAIAAVQPGPPAGARGRTQSDREAGPASANADQAQPSRRTSPSAPTAGRRRRADQHRQPRPLEQHAFRRSRRRIARAASSVEHDPEADASSAVRPAARASGGGLEGLGHLPPPRVLTGERRAGDDQLVTGHEVARLGSGRRGRAPCSPWFHVGLPVARQRQHQYVARWRRPRSTRRAARSRPGGRPARSRPSQSPARRRAGAAPGRRTSAPTTMTTRSRVRSSSSASPGGGVPSRWRPAGAHSTSSREPSADQAPPGTCSPAQADQVRATPGEQRSRQPSAQHATERRRRRAGRALPPAAQARTTRERHQR